MRRADNLTTFHVLTVLKSGSSTFWNPQGVSRSVQGWLYLYLYQFSHPYKGVGSGVKRLAAVTDITDKVTPWQIVLEKKTVSQLVRKLSTFYGTRIFMTVFTTAYHYILS